MAEKKASAESKKNNAEAKEKVTAGAAKKSSKSDAPKKTAATKMKKAMTVRRSVAKNSDDSKTSVSIKKAWTLLLS